MSKYVKKPIEVEAHQFLPLQRPGEMFMEFPVLTDGDGPHLIIPTMEGDMRANHGDWIIIGVKGEKYPCKPDVFDATYSPAADSGNMPFGAALDAMKEGRRIARAGWNGVGMMLFLNKGSHPSGQPVGPRIEGIESGLFESGDNGTVVRIPNISMVTARGSIVTGWLASQTDMLANDWLVLD